MSRTCTICQHPERDAIDAALVEGQSNRAIARQFHVSKDAVTRHVAQHVRPALAKADAEGARGRDLLAEVERLIQRIDGVLTRAEAAKDDRLLLLAARETRGTLELLAKIRGELSDAPTVNLVIAPEWVTFRTVLIQALAPYPDARAAAAQALLAAEATNGGRDGHADPH